MPFRPPLYSLTPEGIELASSLLTESPASSSAAAAAADGNEDANIRLRGSPPFAPQPKGLERGFWVDDFFLDGLECFLIAYLFDGFFGFGFVFDEVNVMESG